MLIFCLKCNTNSHPDRDSAVSKTGVYKGNTFLFLFQNIDCGYSLYRPTSLSRNQGELRIHFEFSEVRDKQIVTRHENCHVRSTLYK